MPGVDNKPKAPGRRPRVGFEGFGPHSGPYVGSAAPARWVRP
ncbi:hypothetical protein [uncultured Thiodictyon sp.]|nr:hypothetical protein [uncultured Thiodictyon sp.]